MLTMFSQKSGHSLIHVGGQTEMGEDSNFGRKILDKETIAGTSLTNYTSSCTSNMTYLKLIYLDIQPKQRPFAPKR